MTSATPSTTIATTTFPPHLDIWRAAREGDLPLLSYLEETKGHNINRINEVNASPLYYAALCGHVACVEYMLGMGAVADEGDFMGERCFYAALNDPLRRLLRQSKMTRAHREPFLECLRLLFEQKDGLWPDVSFHYNTSSNSRNKSNTTIEISSGSSRENSGRAFWQCHQVVLRTRCEFFARQFKQGKWKRCRRGKHISPPFSSFSSIAVLHSQEAFACVLQYLYTARLELPLYLLRDCVKLSHLLRLTDLKEELQKKVIECAIREEEEEEQRAMGVGGGSSRRHLLKQQQQRQKVLIIEPRKEAVVEHFKALAREVVTRFPDDADVVIFTADGKSFALHRVILCARSQYFRTMLKSGFAEGQGGGGGGGEAVPGAGAGVDAGAGSVEEGIGGRRKASSIASTEDGKEEGAEEEGAEEEGAEEEDASSGALLSIHLSISSEALRKVLEYMYCDECLTPLSVPAVFEVLDAATRYMLSGLRKQCSNALMENAEEIDIFFLLELGRMYDLPRLENFVMERMADILEEVVWTDEFLEMVRKSAATVDKREEIDSIPVVDEIRFFVYRMHKFDRNGELERKLGLINQLLEKLGLGS
ncbi:ankyrin repeat and btb poz domain-containing protein 1 [Nannochloropsis oceanica]